MNYIKEINAFYDWLETNSLPNSAIALWHALMHVANKAGWPEEFAVAISTLESKTGLKKDAVIRARNRLQQAGRIKFRSRSGQQSAIYSIIPFEVEAIASQKQTQNNCVGLNDTNCNTNREQSATQTATQTASINKLNKTKLNKDSCSNEQEPNGSGGDEKITNSALIAELVEKYREVIPPEKHQKGDYAFIGRLYNEYGYDEVLLAVNELGYKTVTGFLPQNPLVYLKGMLKRREGKGDRSSQRGSEKQQPVSLEEYYAVPDDFGIRNW